MKKQGICKIQILTELRCEYDCVLLFATQDDSLKTCKAPYVFDPT